MNNVGPDIFLGVYSDYQGIGSILFREEKQHGVIKYLLLKSWSKTGVVSMSEGVTETLDMLTGVSYNLCKPYLNETEGFYNLFRKQRNERGLRFSHFTGKDIDPLEGYQVINSLLAEERIVLGPETVDPISQALQGYSIEEIDHLVYALFHGVAERELYSLRPIPRAYGTARVIW